MGKFLFAGDFCGCKRTLAVLENRNYSSLFEEVKSLTEKVDYSIINLESPLLKKDNKYSKILKCGPNIFSHQNSIDALKYAGFDLFALANNHILDYGERGVSDTIDMLKYHNVDYVGAGMNITEANSNLEKIINGKKYTFINCCEEEFSIATNNSAGASPIDIVDLYYRISEAKIKSDFVILLLHGGIEHFNFPSPRMKKEFHLFIDFGADIVVNTHQHCIGGYEFYKNGVIFYGLGNFCFDREKIDKNWNYGIVCMIDTDTQPYKINIFPIKQCIEKPGIKLLKGDELLNINKFIEEINETIKDDQLLEKKYNIFLESTHSEYSIGFIPWFNRVLDGLSTRNLLPNVFSTNKLLYLRDMYTCISHRDRMIYYINNIIKNRNK